MEAEFVDLFGFFKRFYLLNFVVFVIIIVNMRSIKLAVFKFL